MTAHITKTARGTTVTYTGPDAATEALDAAQDLGIRAGDIDANMIRQLVILDGGTGKIAEEMGYTKGTKEYKSAQRAIQRHQKGTKPTGAWMERYQDLLNQDGSLSITVEGEIVAYAGSEDVRDHCEKKAPTIVNTTKNMSNVSNAVQDPLGAWQSELRNGQFNPIVNRMDSITVSFVKG